MARILLIDDDEICLDSIGLILRLHGYEFFGSLTGKEGLSLARQWKPDVAIVDLRLPDTSGIEVLAQLKLDCPATARVLFSAYATLDDAVDAMRVGACDCLKKPAFEEDIVATVEHALGRQLHSPDRKTKELALPPADAHAAGRWAHPIVRAIEAPQDPRTLREFSRAVFVSVGCFRNWCRTTRVKPRASLSFARGLRAVYRFEHDRATRPENLINIVDQRTLEKFVKKCGGQGDRLPDTVADFLERQQFITNPEAIGAVRTALREQQGFALKGSTVQEPRGAAADRRGSSGGHQ
jgi:DNA-binding NarL/FixJ family response regulator